MEFIVNLDDDEPSVVSDNSDDKRVSGGGLEISVILMKKNLTTKATMGWILGHWRRRGKMISKKI